MTLREFLTRTGLTHTQFARLVGVSDVAVSRYVSGQRMPKREHLQKILEVTDGAVTPNDFVSAVKMETQQSTSVNANY